VQNKRFVISSDVSLSCLLLLLLLCLLLTSSLESSLPLSEHQIDPRSSNASQSLADCSPKEMNTPPLLYFSNILNNSHSISSLDKSSDDFSNNLNDNRIDPNYKDKRLGASYCHEQGSENESLNK
jgi:hypothetical protein